MTIDFSWLTSQFPDLQGIALLSDGGQKLVFSARHPARGEVVLKLIRPNQDVESVRREILAVQQVASARVPQVLEVGTVPTPIGNCIWLLEERIPGQSVREILKQQRTLSFDEVARMALHVLEALESAEDASIVHRDVKPDNIIRDLNGQYWLLDFGIARHLTLDSNTFTAAPFGKFTPGYAPREQFRNIKQDIDARTDLFGLGITLYECLSGYNPFVEGVRNVLEILQRTEATALPRLRLTIPGAAEFGDFLEAITQKRRDHRPASISEALGWMQEIALLAGIDS